MYKVFISKDMTYNLCFSYRWCKIITLIIKKYIVNTMVSFNYGDVYNIQINEMIITKIIKLNNYEFII